MYKCVCGKEFETQSAINAHQISHKVKSERYSISRKKHKTVYKCVQCGIDFEHKNSSKNKFCSSKCAGQHRWENISVPKIENGIATKNSKRYLKEKFGEVCSECGQLPVWNNKPLVLQLDHIDGNSDNNDLINLRLLCPNCHTQTETFGSKGSGNKIKKITRRNIYLRKYQSSEIIGTRDNAL